MSLGFHARLEPRTRADDLTAGLAARVYDATWMLARQWQLGELTGDDGGTPIAVRHTGAITWCTAYADLGGKRALAPGEGPLEAFAEAGPVPLTTRRRVDLGRALLRRLRAAGLTDRIPALLKAFPLTGGLPAGRIPDGGQALERFGAALRAEPPTVPATPELVVDDDLVDVCVTWLEDCAALLGAPPSGAWDERRLTHAVTLDAPSPSGGHRLIADGSADGSLDGWAFDAQRLPPDAAAAATPYDLATIPTRASFRGMPTPRWWQEEDAAIDLGGVEANAADLARMAVLQFALVFGNDHFVLPVPMPVGAVFTTSHLLVTDTFGMTLSLAPAAHAGTGGVRAEGAGRWTMFLPSLADSTGVADVFVLPASAMQRLKSRPVEDVHLLRDEAANLAWAVEAVVEGPDGVARPAERDVPTQPSPPSTGPLRYALGGSVPPNWFPLVPTRTASGDVPELVVRQMANDPQTPDGTLLRLGAAFDDDRIPREGRRVVREHVLARWSDGSTHLWAARRITIGRGEGSSGLDFDDATAGENQV
ncbi:hypothetical protein [Streptomyces europaeiscabiei]|uniref:hypothetical protein n=1 Tax=Streptomyces europaeiscabiei TaxID=146819 RepID=UPI002E1954FA